MVTFSDSRSDTRSRGQLLLVGAAILAVVIVGVVIVVNSALFIENVESSGVSSGVTQVSEIDYNLRQAVRTTTLRVNHRSVGHTGGALAVQVERNITNLSQATRLTYVTSQSTVVTATYENSSSSFGTRVVQEDDDYLTADGSDTGDTTWVPVENRNVGWFVVNLNVTEMNERRVHTNASNANGATVNVTMKKVNDTSPNVNITTSVNGGPGVPTTCDPANGRLLVDVHSGESYTDDSCRFHGTTAIANASTVRISGGDNARGSYSLVANESGSVSGVLVPACRNSGGLGPCRSPVVWTATIDLRVRSTGVAYDTTHNISVYQVDQ